MMTKRIVYELTLSIRSPFMFEGLVNDRLGLDSTFVRGQNGEPVIPAAQAKGVLRDALEHLAAATNMITISEIESLFGLSSAPSSEEQDRPSRGLAFFADLSADAGTASSSITRIAIDDETGTVKTGHLQVIELAAPLGAVSSFRGLLIVRYPQSLDHARIEKAFLAAIRLVPAIGAYKSAGFGEVVPASCSIVAKSSKDISLANAEGPLRCALDVRFDRPLLVNTIRHADNAFSSSTIVPGGAFKGALAEQLSIGGRNPEDPDDPLGDALSKLYVSHAWPQATVDGALHAADLPVPQSLFYVKTADGFLVADAILGPAPGHGIIFKGIAKAPEQASSAKPEVVSAFRLALGLPSFNERRVVRGHVGINEDTNGSRIDSAHRSFTAADEKLYSTSMVANHSETWRLVIDASRIQSQHLALQLLSAFQADMDGIGRTAATASFSKAEAESTVLPDTEMVDIILLSPAVLFDPVEAGGTTIQELEKLYGDYFKTKLGAKLINFFARPALAGQYPAIRRRPYGKAYYPFVQTMPGAVFRLALPDERARKAVTESLSFGLPVPDLGGKATSWKSCPFVPENGYGQVRLHRPAKSKTTAGDTFRWLEADQIEFVEGV